MADKKIPEVDIIVDEKAGVIKEVEQPKKLRSKKGHERRVNGTIEQRQLQCKPALHQPAA